MNAAIRGVCMAAAGRYGMKIIGIMNGFKGFLDESYRTLAPADYCGILTHGGTILGASREKPFDSVEKPGKIADDKVRIICEAYRKLELDCLVALGGNGTNTTASKLAREGLNVIGLPKTIDNDIVGTDLTFGFDSALSVGTDAIDRLCTTAQSHNRIIVIELMGNKAGWLALYAGVAGGGDIILIPEIPYDLKAIGRHLQRRAAAGKTFSVVVAAEGAMSVEEAQMEKKERKKYRKENGPSTAYRIAREINEQTGLETRATVLGYMQRGGTPSASDRLLATALGTAAADLLARGEYGRMVSVTGSGIGSVDLSVPEGKKRTVPADNQMLDTALAVETCLGVDF